MGKYDESIRHYAEQRRHAQEQREGLLSGVTRYGERKGDGPWVDTTDHWIKKLAHEIKQLDELIAAYERLNIER